MPQQGASRCTAKAGRYPRCPQLNVRCSSRVVKKLQPVGNSDTFRSMAVHALAVATVFSVWLPGSAVATESCPILSSLRSAAVRDSFSASKTDGFWYENRFHDLTQVGASCQVVTKKVNSLDDGSFTEEFVVRYLRNLRFPLPLVYTATPQTPGLFHRALYYIPWLRFPSVIVDVDTNASGTQYSAMFEYLCIDWPVHYVEARILTREPEPSAEQLNSLEERARQIGVT